MRNAPDEILNAFRVPIKYKIFAWAITLSIIAIGVYFSHENNDWSILARVGAIIVVISLSLESTGILQNYIDKIVKEIENITLPVVEMQVKRNTNLYGNSENRTDDEIEQITSKELDRRIESIQTLMEKTIYKDLRKTEFAIATVGTLLWGFADLIGNFI